jgi:hypothetical protein
VRVRAVRVILPASPGGAHIPGKFTGLGFCLLSWLIKGSGLLFFEPDRNRRSLTASPPLSLITCRKSENMQTSQSTLLLEYFPKKPVNSPDSPVFRILQDSMAKMQDSMASSVVRGRSYSYAGKIVLLRRQDSMGQYGRLVFVITGRGGFTENSTPRWPIRPFSRICRRYTTGRERGSEMRFTPGVGLRWVMKVGEVPGFSRGGVGFGKLLRMRVVPVYCHGPGEETHHPSRESFQRSRNSRTQSLNRFGSWYIRP